MLPEFRTARLALRQIAVADTAAMHAVFGDPEAMRHWDSPPSADVERTAALVAYLAGVEPRFQGAWVATLDGESAPAAMVNYHSVVASHRRLAVGYILARRLWGRGLMAEAMTALLDHCVDTLDAHRVEALIEPENLPSQRLAERLGFRCESGPLRDRFIVGGEFRSVRMWALFAPEWRARRGAAAPSSEA